MTSVSDKQVSVLDKHLPKWIKNSNLYANMTEDGDQKTFFIPEPFVPNFMVRKIDDIIRITHIFKYWCVNEIPRFIFPILFKHRHELLIHEDFLETIQEFELKNDILVFLEESTIIGIIKHDCYHLLPVVRFNNNKIGIYESIQLDNTKGFQYFNKDQMITDQMIHHIIVNSAYNCLNTLDINVMKLNRFIKLLYDYPNVNILNYFHRKGFKFYNQHIDEFIKRDAVECVKYIYTNINCPLFLMNEYEFCHIFYHNELYLRHKKLSPRCFEYIIFSKYYDVSYRDLVESIMKDCLEYFKIVLECLSHQGVTLDEKHMTCAINFNSKKIIQYLIETKNMHLTQKQVNTIKASEFGYVYNYIKKLGYF